MDGFPDPRDEGAVGGEDIPMVRYDDIDYDDNEDGSGLDIQASEHPSLEEEIENVKLSQLNELKKLEIESILKKYKKSWYNINKIIY